MLAGRYLAAADAEGHGFRWRVLRLLGKRLMMCILRAGVAKLVYAPDSKSGEVHSSCRFESDLRHQCFHPDKLSNRIHCYFKSLVVGIVGHY